MPPLLAAARLEPSQGERVSALTRELLAGPPERGIESFTRRLPLASPAGTALLSLAEALLRVPDAGNADRLIRDQLGSVDWRHAEPGGLLSALLGLAAASAGPAEGTTGGALRSGVSALATPLVRGVLYGAMRALSGRFVYAERIETALTRARREQAAARGASAPQRYSFDMLGEAALTAADAERYLQAYEHAIHAVGVFYRGRGVLLGGGVSVKLSALHPRYSDAQRTRVLAELLPRLRRLALSAQRYELALTIDAEESERLELSLELIEALMSAPELRSWGGLGVAVQAYQKRAPAVIEHLIALAARRGPPLLLRLVKGAYWDAEIKLAQLQGLAGFPVYSRKVYTDVAYLACARRMLAAPGSSCLSSRPTMRRRSPRCWCCRRTAAHPRWSSSVSTAWARPFMRARARSDRSGARCGCTHRSVSARRSWPISCGGCSRTARPPRSCIARPRAASRSTA